MSDAYNSKFLDEPDFQSLLVACLESLQRDEMIDRQWRWPEIFHSYAAEVEQFLDDQEPSATSRIRVR